jgi:hypothetical protein
MKKLYITHTIDIDYTVPLTKEYYLEYDGSKESLDQIIEKEKKRDWEFIKWEVDGPFDVRNTVEVIEEDDL